MKKPRNEATPLGTPREKKSKKSKTASEQKAKAANWHDEPVESAATDGEQQKSETVIDNVQTETVESAQQIQDPAPVAIPQTSVQNNNVEKTQRTRMDITVTKDPKARKTNSIVYSTAGLRGTIRVPRSMFANATAPDSFVISSDAFAEPKAAKVKLTPEERKAARANRPQLTLAEKIAKREAALAKLREKMNQEAAAASSDGSQASL
jgi:hypothetical protein